MESQTARKARLRQAAGEGWNICVPYVQQHPFFTAKRKLFKLAENCKRDADAAAVAAESGPIVWVRRQFDDHRHAAYRLAEVGGWHRSDISGGVSRGPTGNTCTPMSAATA